MEPSELALSGNMPQPAEHFSGVWILELLAAGLLQGLGFMGLGFGVSGVYVLRLGKT